MQYDFTSDLRVPALDITTPTCVWLSAVLRKRPGDAWMEAVKRQSLVRPGYLLNIGETGPPCTSHTTWNRSGTRLREVTFTAEVLPFRSSALVEPLAQLKGYPPSRTTKVFLR